MSLMPFNRSEWIDNLEDGSDDMIPLDVSYLIEDIIGLSEFALTYPKDVDEDEVDEDKLGLFKEVLSQILNSAKAAKDILDKQ